MKQTKTEWQTFENYRVRYVLTPELPPWELVHRVGALCFWQGQIILIREYNSTAWTPPGGRVEPYETHQEQVLHREIMEEACARIGRFVQIGYREVETFDPDDILRPHYVQPFYWCEISELLPWQPEMEIEERRLVEPADFFRVVEWSRSREVGMITMLKAALEYGK